MKRFYESVSVEEAGEGRSFRINLDARPVKTPARRELLVPSRALADAIAEEWRAQAEKVEPASMPLTRLASVAVDRIAGRRMSVIDEIATYAETDLLCYRADHPAALAKRQHEIWQPNLDWIEQRHKAGFAITVGVNPATQSSAAVDAIKTAIAGHDDMSFLVRPGFSDVITLRESGMYGVDHFGFMLKDSTQLDAAIAELEKCGGRLLEKTKLEPGGAPAAFILDPDGYHVQI